MKVIQIIPNLNLGGAEIMVENLSVSLLERGMEAKVVSFYNIQSAITDRLQKKNIPIHYLYKKRGLDFKIIFRLHKYFKSERPDVIHTHLYTLPYVFIASIFTKIPIKIHTIHSMANKEVSSFKRKIHKILFKKFGVVPVAISPQVKKSVMKEYRLQDQNVPMVFNGIDLSNCRVKTEYAVKDEFLDLLHIGSFKTAKNHEVLIESFEKVHNKYPHTKLKLIGDGPLNKTIIEKVKEMSLSENIEFLGLKSNVYPYLKQADIFLLPSIWEGMPITIIEAMGTGTPIIATNVGGIPDMIQNNKTGILVENDVEEIASAIINLMEDMKLREHIGREARKKSSEFASILMAESYLALYRRE